MNVLLVIVRAIHLGATLLLFGELVFATAVARPVLRGIIDRSDDFRRWNRVVVRWSLWASIFAAVVWLVLEAGLMSGLPIDDAMHGGALGVVLAKTTFGRVWLLRLGFAALLAMLMIVDAGRAHVSATMRWVVLATAAGYVASLALTGHAAAGQGDEYYARVLADATHLLAAGGWLGALPGLAYLMATIPADHRRAPAGASIDVAAEVTRRFSAFGIACVGVLLASGSVNAWYLAGGVPELIGTGYGRLLLVKIALFVAMVMLASTNRLHLAPRIVRRDPAASRALTRNAIIEIVLGIIVVAIVGALGVMVPATHQPPVWPLDFTVTLEPGETSAGVVWMVAVGACFACVAGAFVLAARRPRAAWMGLAAVALVATALVTCPWIAVSPAYPTTYAIAPDRYSTAAVAHGAATFAANCAPCHGALGHGDGPLAASLVVKPANLIAHAIHHRPGELFWWIAHGIPRTPMPAFSPRLDDNAIWNVIHYLQARADADAAQALTNRIEPWQPIVAPDFTFETAHGQETLDDQRGREALLVSYTLPQSLPRLRELASATRQLDAAGIRVIAVPAASNAAPADGTRLDVPTLASVGPDVASTYAMFACAAGADCTAATPSHVEWLIDREGYLRGRWIGVPANSAERTDEVQARVEMLHREAKHPRTPQSHMH